MKEIMKLVKLTLLKQNTQVMRYERQMITKPEQLNSTVPPQSDQYWLLTVCSVCIVQSYIRGGLKKYAITLCPYLHQMLINFHNFFASGLC